MPLRVTKREEDAMRSVRGKTKESEPKEVRKKVCKIDGVVLKPYVGKDDLPREKLDSKGNVVEQGESRYFVTRASDSVSGGACYKLVRVYRARGIKRSLIRVLKVKKRDERGAKDREILRKLKEAEIPGAI